MRLIASAARNNVCSKRLRGAITAAATTKKLFLSACRWLIEEAAMRDQVFARRVLVRARLRLRPSPSCLAIAERCSE